MEQENLMSLSSSEEEEEVEEEGNPREGVNQACAACKFQRKRCTDKCQMAPYFPPERATVFQNFHRLFGVKKIQKLLETMPENEKEAAMGALIFQSEVRRREPVHGCAIFINQLDLLIRHAEFELQHVLSHLSFLRQQQLHHHHHHHAVAASTSQFHMHPSSYPLPPSPPADDVFGVSPATDCSSLPPLPSPLLQYHHQPDLRYDYHVDALLLEGDDGLYNNVLS